MGITESDEVCQLIGYIHVRLKTFLSVRQSEDFLVNGKFVVTQQSGSKTQRLLDSGSYNTIKHERCETSRFSRKTRVSDEVGNQSIKTT